MLFSRLAHGVRWLLRFCGPRLFCRPGSQATHRVVGSGETGAKRAVRDGVEVSVPTTINTGISLFFWDVGDRRIAFRRPLQVVGREF